MSQVKQPTILVIVGISGDLSRRYLLPAIKQIAQAGALPEAFRIVGVSRRQLQLSDVVSDDHDFWEKHIELHQMDLEAANAYHDLANQLEGVERSLGGAAQRLFYLSVPPEAVQNVVTMLGESGLANVTDTKLLLEKPFGTNLATAEELIAHITKFFSEDQVYRIDHYLAKEMAQNVIVFRNSNPLFAHTWNKDFIASVEICMSETIGIEGRAGFYEQTGALRDVVQSHVLQLVALTLMELPDDENWQDIPTRRLQALEAIQPVQPSEAIRGQYDTYKTEVKNPASNVETFASLKLTSQAPLWHNVHMSKAKAKKAGKAKAGTRLATIGLWATIWWAASGLFVIALVWASRNLYIERVTFVPGVMRGWLWAFSNCIQQNAFIAVFAVVVVLGWGILTVIWLQELKRRKISYQAGLKDLFLTIRR